MKFPLRARRVQKFLHRDSTPVTSRKRMCLKNVDADEVFNPMNVHSPSRRHVITVHLAGKVSFLYSCMQTRLMGQYYRRIFADVIVCIFAH